MGKIKFRIQAGLLLAATLISMTPLGAIFGFFAIWALIIAAAPFIIAASFLAQGSGPSLPQWTPAVVLGAIGACFTAGAVGRLVEAGKARRGGNHESARRFALSSFVLFSIPSCFLFSVRSLEQAWP